MSDTSNALSIDCHCVPMEDRPCDSCKLAAVDEQLQRMIVSAEVYVDVEQTITGYKIKTGALHRLIGLRNLFVPQRLPVVSAHEPCARQAQLANELESDMRAQGSKVIEFHHSRVRAIIEALRAAQPPSMFEGVSMKVLEWPELEPASTQPPRVLKRYLIHGFLTPLSENGVPETGLTDIRQDSMHAVYLCSDVDPSPTKGSDAP